MVLGRVLSAAAALFALVACSALTGADDYHDVRCTTGAGNESCANLCHELGGTSWIAATSTCICGDGRPFCGPFVTDIYASCCSAGEFCDIDDQGNPFCNQCHPCGGGCCTHEGETCLNPTSESCGVIYGTSIQSCAGGSTCGGAGCCDSVALVGTFPFGRSASGKDQCPTGDTTCDVDEQPEVPVTLSDFRLDRFEATVARFRSFVDHWDYQGLPWGAGANINVPETGWELEWNAQLPQSRADLVADISCPGATWTDAPGDGETRPINCVSWYEAFAFCAWDGGRLPTEAEWEYAAANGATNDLHPWGTTAPSATMAAYDCSRDAVPCASPPSGPAAVGSFPSGANASGLLDLAGNVSEWTRDALEPYPLTPSTDYAFPSVQYYEFPVTRGGAFDGIAGDLRAARRVGRLPSTRSASIGVRCARNP